MTNTNTPPGYMFPEIGTALGQANSLLSGPGPQFYPGQQVASFNPLQSQAFGGIQSLAGSNPLGAASAYNDSLLSGKFTGPNAALAATGQGGVTNPLLDQMFGQAAGSTRNQLSSEFAGSGRNMDAAQPLRGEQLNNLATQIYGGAYDANQNRALTANQTLAGEQQGAVSGAEGLTGANLGIQNALLGAGNQVQGQSQQLIDASKKAFDYNQTLPYQNLQQFESSLSGVQPGSAQSSPYFTNPTANALGEAGLASSVYSNMGTKGAKAAV